MIPEVLRGIEGLQELQEPPCVYFLVDKDEVVYVGQTLTLGARINAHRKDKVFDQVFYVPVPAKDLLTVEDHWINTLKPKYNRAVNPRDVTPEETDRIKALRKSRRRRRQPATIAPIMPKPQTCPPSPKSHVRPAVPPSPSGLPSKWRYSPIPKWAQD